MGKMIADRGMKLVIICVHLLLSLLMFALYATFPVPLGKEIRLRGNGLVGNRIWFTYWLANAFVFFVRDNLVDSPKLGTNTVHLLGCFIQSSMLYSKSFS